MTATTKINDHLTISSHPAPDALAKLPAQGFGGIVNAQPDGELADQISAAEERSIVHGLGLNYAFIPVTLDTITAADVEAFQSATGQTQQPVFAYCRSGMRALTLQALGEVAAGRLRADAVLAFGRQHGFDLTAAARWLERDALRKPAVKGFFDPRTWSVQYVVSDPETKRCAIIDPVLDFDEKSGATGTASADALLAYVAAEGLTVEWILDTHPHADHFSAAHYLHGKTGAPTAIGAHVTDVQTLWKGIYNWPSFPADGSQWNRLFAAGDRFKLGNLDGRVLFSPGHTLASVTYVIGDAAFVHDTMFMPDSGTARADFPGGSARALWASIQDILALPDETRIFTGHDYQPNGRNPRWESTVAQQKRSNPHLANIDEAAFIALREARDRTLPMPKLILHALQVNMNGGRLPVPESDGKRYLKFPLDALKGAAW